MLRTNVAKINLEVSKCMDCPFANYPAYHGEWFCTRELKTPGVPVGGGATVPDFCPFVLERLERVVETMESGTVGSMPKKWLNAIERKQRDYPDPKFGADHSFNHAARVYKRGADFLEQCVGFDVISNNSVQRLKLMLKIAATLHDVGLADSAKCHAIHSAELAKKYLESKKIDIDDEDKREIIHAIFNHSNGEDTRNALDAALILGDKLDVTKERIVRTTDILTRQVRKIDEVKFELFGKIGEIERVELRYKTNSPFDVGTIRHWPKCVRIPQMIALEFVEAKEFKFFVDDEEVDIEALLK